MLDGNEDVVNAYYPRASLPFHSQPSLYLNSDPPAPTVDWRVHAKDADKALHWFFTECAASPACAVHEPTAAAVKSRVDKILASVAAHPVPVPGGGKLTLVALKSVLLLSTYEPVSFYGPVAAGLRALELGDPAPIYAFVGVNGDGVENAVVCTDAYKVRDTPKELKQYAKEIEPYSKYFSSFVASFRLFCSYVILSIFVPIYELTSSIVDGRSTRRTLTVRVTQIPAVILS